MSIDREATLKKAEKLLRQGKLDGAIQEYVRLVEEQPRDWNAINALGDLYARAGEPDRAVAQFTRVADHLYEEGFFPKAAALYKKALKTRNDYEPALVKLGEIATRQGLTADAKLYLGQLATLRRARGDERGAAESLVALGALPDPELKLSAARAARGLGDTVRASALFREAADAFEKQERRSDALDALVEAAQLDPSDSRLRSYVVNECIAAGDLERAGQFLTRESAGDSAELLLAFGTMELTAGHDEEARAAFARLLLVAPDQSAAILAAAEKLIGEGRREAAFACVDMVVETALVAGDIERALTSIEAFLRHGPHIPALMKLVELAVDAAQDDVLRSAQERLADAYLDAGRGSEAHVIAEDLVAHDPNGTNLDRLRRALALVGEPDVEAAIAHYLEQRSLPQVIDFEDATEITPEETPVKSVEPDPEVHLLDESEAQAERIVVEATEVDLSDALGRLKSGAPPVPAPPVMASEEPQARPSAESSEKAAERASAKSPQDLQAVFEQMRSRTREHQGTAPAAQLQRGLDHLDNGRIAEGIIDLQAASRTLMLRFPAAARLGRLYASAGELETAVNWLERAAEAPAPSRDDGLTVLYELAEVLERMGERERALALLLEIDADASGYRDVRTRIEQLTRAQAGSRGL